jgi:hypothetical protein
MPTPEEIQRKIKEMAKDKAFRDDVTNSRRLTVRPESALDDGDRAAEINLLDPGPFRVGNALIRPKSVTFTLPPGSKITIELPKE